MKAIDCAASTSKVIPALKKAGIGLVIRYFVPSSWKNAKGVECDALRKGGIDIAAVYETTADMMLSGGRAAGVAGAKAAKAAIIACGGPAAPFVWFACDTNTTNTAAVIDYTKGAQSVLGAAKVGVYGSGTVVQAVHKATGAAMWQSTSTGWRGYLSLALATVRGVSLCQRGAMRGALGISYDGDIVLKDNVGQWGYKAPAPKPAPAPVVPAPVVPAPKPTPAPPAPPKPPVPAYNRVVTYTKAFIRLNPNVHSKVLATVHKNDKLEAIPGGTVLWAKTTRGYILRTRVKAIR